MYTNTIDFVINYKNIHKSVIIHEITLKLLRNIFRMVFIFSKKYKI